jgi:hypothetical protein
VNSRRVADSELPYPSRYLLYSETEQIRVLQKLNFILHSKKKDNVVSIYSFGSRKKLLAFPLDK